MKKFTRQEVINIGADMYDNKGFTRDLIWNWLVTLWRNDQLENCDFIDLKNLFDIIV